MTKLYTFLIIILGLSAIVGTVGVFHIVLETSIKAAEATGAYNSCMLQYSREVRKHRRH